MTPSEEKAKTKNPPPKEAAAPELDLVKGLNATAWGLIASAVALGIFVYALGDDLIAETGAGSSWLVMANFWIGFLFYLILATVAWEYWPVAALKKEIRAVVLFAICAVASQLTQYILVEGHPSAIGPGYNYYWLMAALIAVLLISLLAFEAWPVGAQPQPMKGAVISAEMLVAALLIYYISDNDHNYFGSENDWMSIVWIPSLVVVIPWIIWYAVLMEGWPFGGLAQPVKGLAISAVAAVLCFITYALAATIPEEGHHFSGLEGGRASDYVTFTAVWTAVLVAVIWCLSQWPFATGKLSAQPIKGIAAFLITGIIAAIVLYGWAQTVGVYDPVTGLEWTDTGGATINEEYVVPAVWFYVYVPSFLLMIGVWLDHHA